MFHTFKFNAISPEQTLPDTIKSSIENKFYFHFK